MPTYEGCIVQQEQQGERHLLARSKAESAEIATNDMCVCVRTLSLFLLLFLYLFLYLLLFLLLFLLLCLPLCLWLWLWLPLYLHLKL